MEGGSHELGSKQRADLATVVYRGLREWTGQSAPDSSAYVKYSIRGFLRRYLRRTPFRSSAATVDTPKRSGDCDVTIGDRIGIKVLYGLNDGSKEWIHKQLRSILLEYDHLIVYGHRISAKYTDLWRQIKRSLDRYSTDANHIRIVGTIEGGRYVVPLTTFAVSKEIVQKFGIYGLFFAFVLASGHFLDGVNHGHNMGVGFVGVVIVLNLSIMLMGGFLLRYL